MRVTVGCGDPRLSASVVAVASAGGVVADCVSTAAALAALWRASDVVVVDSDVGQAIAAASLPPGPAVVVVVAGAETSGAWQLAAALGALSVIALPEGETHLLDVLLGAPARRRIEALSIGVIGCGGGAGASSVAVALAAAAARVGLRTALVDLDPTAGGIDLLLGCERLPGLRWPELSQTPALLDGSLVRGLPTVAGVAVLSWDRRSVDAAVDPLLTSRAVAALSAEHDVLVLDVARGAAASDLRGCDEALLVCSRQVRAAAAAGVIVDSIAVAASRLRLVAGGAGAPELSARDLADAIGLPLVATLPKDRRVPRQSALGALHDLPRRGPTMRVCARLLAQCQRSPDRAQG